MKIVEIEWEDSVHAPGWVEGPDAIDYAKGLMLTARTIGYLIYADDVKVTVVQSLGKFEVGGAPADVDAIMTIPRRAVVKARFLK